MARQEIIKEVSDYRQVDDAVSWVGEMLTRGLKAGPVRISMGRPRRSVDQNAKLWPMLHDVASQCILVINGHEVQAKPEDWKDVFTAALKREQRVANGIDGGLVFLGQRTSKMRKAEFSELIELIYAYGSEHGVQWSEASNETLSNLPY